MCQALGLGALYIYIVLFNMYIVISETNSFDLDLICENGNLERVTSSRSRAELGFDLRLV